MLMKSIFAKHLTPSYVHIFFQRGNMGVIMFLKKMTGIWQNKRIIRTATLNEPLFYSSLQFIET